jgi:UDP-glucose 4-epimerase
MNNNGGCKDLAHSRCIVLGGGGFIGTNLCERLIALGSEVVLISPALLDPQAVRGAQWIRATLDETHRFEQAIRPGDLVFHLVSTTVPASSNADPCADIADNLLPTLKLLDTLRGREVRKLVFLSSGGTVYGRNVPTPTSEEAANDPLCSYGIQKLAIEKYLALYRHLHGVESVTLRVSNPFGPYQLGGSQGVIGTFMRKALLGEPISIWGDGSVVRDYIFIADLVDAILRAALVSDREAPCLYNVGSGEGRSLRDIVAAVERVHGRPLAVRYEPSRSSDVPLSILDISRAQRHLGWKPGTAWNDALEKTYSWLLQRNGRSSSS